MWLIRVRDMTLTWVRLDFWLQVTVLNHCCNALQLTAINYSTLLRTAAQRDTMTRVRHDSWLRLNTLNITATHCNALQRTATHCSVLQRTATHCNALQRTAMHCTALLRTAPQSIALHRTAPYCTVLHRTATHCTTLHCNTPQRTATHCNSLQHTATHCNTLQHTAQTHPWIEVDILWISTGLLFWGAKSMLWRGLVWDFDPGGTSERIFVRGTCAWYKHELTSIIEFYLSY